MLRQFFRYLWGVIVRPRATFDALAAEHSIRWALLLEGVGLLLGWGNVAFFYACGYNWLGTRPLLADPAFVGLFGYLRINLDSYVPFFVVVLPLLNLLGLIVVPGIAHLLSKLWRGQGTFEQMINALVFAIAVPSLVIANSSEILFGVPINVLTGHPYWWVAAMSGEFGPLVGIIWNSFVIGIYATGQYLWAIVLGAIAIRRIQKVPWWAAIVSMVAAFAVWMCLVSTLVR
jgi:hypothetical protein